MEDKSKTSYFADKVVPAVIKTTYALGLFLPALAGAALTIDANNSRELSRSRLESVLDVDHSGTTSSKEWNAAYDSLGIDYDGNKGKSLDKETLDRLYESFQRVIKLMMLLFQILFVLLVALII